MLKKLGELICGFWGGHHFLMVREPAQLKLQCCHCGKASIGWEIAPKVLRYRHSQAYEELMQLDQESRLGG